MNIYVASSWRNVLQPHVVKKLREMGHHCYDFRHPTPGSSGFSWSQVDERWQDWTPAQYRSALDHPAAKSGFDLDMEALRNCDCVVCVLPSGRPSSFELGWATGAGKLGAVFMLETCAAELMYSGLDILTSWEELESWSSSLVSNSI